MPTFDQYMKQYDHEHHNAWNKLLHAVGIPIIFAGIILLALMKWQWGLGFFAGGWVLLFLGHKIEGNKPAFFQGAAYLLVGPVWVAKEIKELVQGRGRSGASAD
jgi:uncharacterized membrane protein YGL010W